jgi:hypothetical protein
MTASTGVVDTTGIKSDDDDFINRRQFLWAL